MGFDELQSALESWGPNRSSNFHSPLCPVNLAYISSQFASNHRLFIFIFTFEIRYSKREFVNQIHQERSWNILQENLKRSSLPNKRLNGFITLQQLSCLISDIFSFFFVGNTSQTTRTIFYTLRIKAPTKAIWSLSSPITQNRIFNQARQRSSIRPRLWVDCSSRSSSLIRFPREIRSVPISFFHGIPETVSTFFLHFVSWSITVSRGFFRLRLFFLHQFSIKPAQGWELELIISHNFVTPLTSQWAVHPFLHFLIASAETPWNSTNNTNSRNNDFQVFVFLYGRCFVNLSLPK